MPTIGGIVVATGAHATERRRFIDVIDELARPIDGADATIRAHAADAFRAAVRKMNNKGLWPWEIQDEDVAMVANERFSTVTGVVKKPLRMHYLSSAGGTRDRPLRYISYDRFLEKYTLDVTSDPHTYTIPNMFETGQIRWFPTPGANDNLRFSYYRATPVPKLEQEVIEIPEGPSEAYMAFAWLEFLKRLPSQQRPFPITVAMSEARRAFIEISSHVTVPGDMSRQVSSGGIG